MQAIIRNYLETGEPVGSRTISKYTDLNLSSATIHLVFLLKYHLLELFQLPVLLLLTGAVPASGRG